VLSCAIAAELYRRFPALPEGSLTQLLSGLVREETLAQVGRNLELARLLRIGAHVQITDAVLADAVEAMFGAVFCDAGYEAVRAAILRIFTERLSRLGVEGLRKDAKSELQELLQSRGQKPPQYEVAGKQGEGHRLKWQVKCVVAASGLESAGSGSSLQRAQQEAARAMLELLRK
jgi:ribonuclease-3